MEKHDDYRVFFRGKKITMLGLGVLGRGVNVAKFLARLGADLTITDLKSPDVLAPSLRKLKSFETSGKIHYTLGTHRFEDFRDKDMVIKAAGVPLDSPYIAEARKHGIPIEMDASLFARFCPATIVGITGTRGKTTTTYLIHDILRRSGKKVFLGGNIRGMATLPLLEKISSASYVVLELDSWQLQGFGEAHISPRVAVFTSFFPDHLNYYRGRMDRYFRDKANIFKFQKGDDVLIASRQAAREIRRRVPRSWSPNMTVPHLGDIPPSWNIKILGEHNRSNITCAVGVGRFLEIPLRDIKSAVEHFRGVPGRLELVRTVRGVRYVNDTTATTPEGNMAAIKALHSRGGRRALVLIAGGADKELDYTDMARLIHKTAKGLILIEGAATEKILSALPRRRVYPLHVVSSMGEALRFARVYAKKGDAVLLSPGAASFGVFKNEFDRGDQFVAMVKKIR